MSRTIPSKIGCNDASYYEYGASVIKESLENALQNEGVVGPIPKGILIHLQNLFKITLKQNTGNSLVDHIMARLHTIAMARGWFNAYKPNASEKEFQDSMQIFLSLLERLSPSKSIFLNQHEQEIARQLVLFLNQLISEAYRRSYAKLYGAVF